MDQKKVFSILVILLIICNCDLFIDDSPYSGITETVIDTLENNGQIEYRIISEDPDDWDISYKPLPTDKYNLPTTYQIGPAFPNPVSDSTFIKLAMASNKKIHIYVKNENDKLVKTIINDTLSAGYYHLYWNLDNEYGNKVNSGIYRCFYEIENARYIDSVYYSIFGHGDIKVE